MRALITVTKFFSLSPLHNRKNRETFRSFVRFVECRFVSQNTIPVGLCLSSPVLSKSTTIYSPAQSS